jgi:parvulin-like peptidyl-prolyl isomerase
MLKVMRKHAKYFYVLFFIVILSFLFWGIGTVDKTGKGEIVAEIGKHKITVQDYWRSYENVDRFYREIYKDKFDEAMEKKLNLKERVLDSMIQEQVLLIAAKEEGISISDEELQDAITHEPAFLRNGVFDKDVYQNRLRLMRITVEEYERSKRQELLLNKMRHLIELSVDVPDENTNLQKPSGDEKSVNMLREAMLSEKQEKAVSSYVEGLKKGMKIKVDTKLIS